MSKTASTGVVFAHSAPSHRFGLLGLFGVFAALLLVNAACSPRVSELYVPLEYTSGGTGAGSLPLTDLKLHLAPVTEKMENPEQIGVNKQKDVPIPIYTSGKKPGEFVYDALESELQGLGFDLTDAPEAADRVIAIDLNKFYATEAPNFLGEARATVEVRDKSGKSLWKGAVAGDRKTFGRTLSAANYKLVLSDATRRMIGSLLQNPGFQKALAE